MLLMTQHSTTKKMANDMLATLKGASGIHTLLAPSREERALGFHMFTMSTPLQLSATYVLFSVTS